MRLHLGWVHRSQVYCWALIIILSNLNLGTTYIVSGNFFLLNSYNRTFHIVGWLIVDCITIRCFCVCYFSAMIFAGFWPHYLLVPGNTNHWFKTTLFAVSKQNYMQSLGHKICSWKAETYIKDFDLYTSFWTSIQKMDPAPSCPMVLCPVRTRTINHSLHGGGPHRCLDSTTM